MYAFMEDTYKYTLKGFEACENNNGVDLLDRKQGSLTDGHRVLNIYLRDI